MIAFVWQFDVKPGKETEFEQLVGADGPWHRLSRRSRSFLGSSFLHDSSLPSRYLVIEYWSEMLVYEKHQEDFRHEIERLEREREGLLDSALPLGIFNALNVPDRAGPTWTRRTGQTEVAQPKAKS